MDPNRHAATRQIAPQPLNALRRLVKHKDLAPRLALITSDAWENLRALGKNDKAHSAEIERILDALIPDKTKGDPGMLKEEEVLPSLVAVYLHGIGRTTNPDHREQESYDPIRNNAQRMMRAERSRYPALRFASPAFAGTKTQETRITPGEESLTFTIGKPSNPSTPVQPKLKQPAPQASRYSPVPFRSSPAWEMCVKSEKN